MADEKLVKMGILGGIIIGVLGTILLVILLPMSFSYLDFFEVRFFINYNRLIIVIKI